MEYTGNGIQNWFLKEMALLIYYAGLQKDVNLPNPQILKFETFLTAAIIFDQTGPFFLPVFKLI